MLAGHWYSLQLDGQAATTHELHGGFPAGACTADAELDTLAAQAVRDHDLTQAVAGRRTTRYDRSRPIIRSFP